ncbi:MAG TPA: type II secretion system protein [Phycisphaerae bacterium]|nr:type II secretion system protein [Phycisphaerae bacterium]
MSKNEKHGFALIELLVVIAILALLISILTPSIKEAKKLARKAFCLANMNTGKLNTAWPQYSNNCYDMVYCDIDPGEHKFTVAFYQVDRVPKPGPLMMLEDKFVKVVGKTQPYLGRCTLNKEPHFKEDNIVFFDGHAVTASPQEIYRQEYWLTA